MKFTKYDNLGFFGSETLEILLEHEVQNNLPISFIRNEQNHDTSKWLLISVKDDAGSIVLTAACTPPHNIVLYETGNMANEKAVKLMSEEIKNMGITLPGVLAEQGLARRFAETYAGAGGFIHHMSMNIMQLDKVSKIPNASGFCRPLDECDLFYVPYWIRSFEEECKIEMHDIPTNIKRTMECIGKDTHYIWVDGHPVSYAESTQNTQNGGGINRVYTPPNYRGRGYASSVVASLSQILLERGYKFCYLFADAGNPISCGVYRKIGFYDRCVYDEIKFANEERE